MGKRVWEWCGGEGPLTDSAIEERLAEHSGTDFEVIDLNCVQDVSTDVQEHRI